MRWLALIDFAAAVQGLLLAFFLFKRHWHSLQYRSMGALVVVMSLLLAGGFLGNAGLFQRWPHLMRIVDPFALLLGPMLYFHVRLSTTGSLPRSDRLHLVPFFAYALFLIPTFYLLPGREKLALMDGFMNGYMSPQLLILLAVRTVHMSAYSFLSLALIRRFHRALQARYSNLEKRDMRRSVVLLRCFVGLTLGMIIIILFSTILHLNIIAANGVFGLLLGACVFGLAYAQWMDRSTERDPRPLLLPTLADAGLLDAHVNGGSMQRSARSVHNVNGKAYSDLVEKLVEALEKRKSYLESDLDLGELSARMEALPYQVSEVINRHYRSSFFDTVNRLRVEEVKLRLMDPAFAALSILGVAMESGFNTKSSFNTAFRKHAGTTPSEFRNRVRQVEAA